MDTSFDISAYIIPALIIVGFAILIFVGFYFSAKSRILRELKKVRRKAIHSARENEYVKIVGKAKHAGEPLIAPLSNRKCVYYAVKVEEQSGKHWKTIIDDVVFQDFFISTGTESAILNLKVQKDNTKRIYLVTDHSINSGFFKKPDAEIERYLQLKGNKSTGFFGMNKTLRYKESVIELNEEIAVMGIAKWQTIDTPVDGYSDSRVLTLTGSKEQKLLVTDEPKAMKRVKRKL
ncbi:hypothetical protein H2O64_21795 [Kordia sp. YSTF-M3]|uniref:RING-type E3 ubiquitin transferase n=1 Tax=Kordia aestuariivivens TaxID=2759037 RepID=A0ABR7QFH9_9FLAO|nr:hypothetical protein [Kordia aestuariivivens]MBC8757317.1 hypothetical protein [Kordia aestuariivivens]